MRAPRIKIILRILQFIIILIISLFFQFCHSLNMQTESKNQELSQKTEKTNQVDKSQKSISREKVIPDPEIARDGFARIIHYEFTNAYMDYLYNPYKKAGKPIIAFTKFETYCIFRPKPASDSGINLPPVPAETCQSFRSKPAT